MAEWGTVRGKCGTVAPCTAVLDVGLIGGSAIGVLLRGGGTDLQK